MSGSADADVKPVAILLMGPTASGKTDLAMRLYRELACEIISVDSALVYRGMNIGTAKPSAEELALVPHRLIDICEPTEAYSAARFRNDALHEMGRISAEGKIPLLVGGTMLYYSALQHGLSKLPEADPGTRARLEQEAHKLGWGAMHERLSAVDPQAAARIHPNDPQRIQRALEVYELTGKPLSVLQRLDEGQYLLPYRVVKLALTGLERPLLHERIERRFHAMLAEDLEGELRMLLKKYPLRPDMPSMRAVGYRQMLAYVNGEMSRNEMIFRAIIATRQLAKRQMTWLRRELGAHWLDPLQQDIVAQALKLIGNVPT